MYRFISWITAALLLLSSLYGETTTERFFITHPYEKIKEELFVLFLNPEPLTEEELQFLSENQILLTGNKKDILHRLYEMGARRDPSSLVFSVMGKLYAKPILEKDFTLFDEIIAHETEQLIGYHSTSQKFGLFQDCLRILYEEMLGISLPNNFHLMRVPGKEYHWCYEECLYNFLTPAPPPEVSIPHRNAAIQFFILNPVNEQYKIYLTPSDFSEEEIEKMFQLLYLQRELFTELKHDRLYLDCPYPPFPEISDKVAIGQVASIVVQKIEEDEKRLNDFLMARISVEVLSDFFTLTHLINSFREFLYESTGEKSTFFEAIKWLDIRHEIQQKLLSLNVSFLANYKNYAESSLFIYLQDQPLSGGDQHVLSALEAFIEKLGLPKSLATTLLDEGEKILVEAQIDRGIILQLFDESKFPFQVTDRISYINTGYGIPIQHAEKIATSKLLQGELPLSINHHTTHELQIRLFLDNKTTLNPNSSIKILRYDNRPPEVQERILLKLRSIIQKLK